MADLIFVLRRDRDFRDALFYGESRRSLQSLGRVGNLRLNAQPIHHFPLGV
jgi:hypothetical protein